MLRPPPILILLSAALACRAGLRLSDGGPARHGGRMLQAEGLSFELVVHRRGLEIYPLDGFGIPLTVESLGGEVRLVRAGRVRLLPLAPGRGPDGTGRLEARRPMAHFAESDWTVEVHLEGLPEVPGGRVVVSTPLPPLPADTEGRVLARGAPELAALLPAYPTRLCPVSGEALGPRPIDYLWGTRLIRFCTAGCVGVFLAAPRVVLDRLDGKAPFPQDAPPCHAPEGAR